jgi:YebC/PmpR family DNA-binding regulatory protein
MPKDNIKRAIQAASGERGGSAFEELNYEGYGPGGVAILVCALTDNRNRTASDVKFIFERGGGNLGSTGSVAFLFDFKAIFVAEQGERSEDEWMEVALEAGAEDVELSSGMVTLTAPAADFLAVKQALEKAGIELASAETGHVPQNSVAVGDKEDARRVLKLLSDLDDHDDVQSVWSNEEISDEWLEELQA